MSKAFTKEVDDLEEEELPEVSGLPAGAKNYITPGGYARLKRTRSSARHRAAGSGAHGSLGGIERRSVGEWRHLRQAALARNRPAHSLPDQAPGKRRGSRSEKQDSEQIFFGATVTVSDQNDEEQTVSIVGMDEVDPAHGYVSWISPIARALLKARVGDAVKLATPSGLRELEVIDVRYQRLAT